MQNAKADPEIVALKEKSEKALKSRERDERKKKQQEKKKRQEEQSIVQEILKREIRIDAASEDLRLDLLEPRFPELANHRVRCDASGRLIWPAAFLYPEYQIMDFVQEFPEDDT